MRERVLLQKGPLPQGTRKYGSLCGGEEPFSKGFPPLKQLLRGRGSFRENLFLESIAPSWQAYPRRTVFQERAGSTSVSLPLSTTPPCPLVGATFPGLAKLFTAFMSL